MRAFIHCIGTFFLVLGWGGCGPHVRHAADVRRDLSAMGIEEARVSAPDLVAAAYRAADEAERAFERGDLDASADHATRARLEAIAALAEHERALAEHERASLESETTLLEERAVQDETATRAIEAEIARTRAARAAREELQRALELAERDEAHPVRRARVSIVDDAEMRRAALAIRERARLLAAAASAMGAETIVLARAEELAGLSAGTSSPRQALELAEQAHEAARDALASARRTRPAPTREEIASLLEAARESGLSVMRFERGLGVEVGPVFRGSTSQPLPGSERRLARIASLLRMHPHGPIAIEVDVPGMGTAATRLSRARGEWARHALISAGVAAERIHVREPGTSMPSAEAADRVRVVLVAYVDPL